MATKAKKTKKTSKKRLALPANFIKNFEGARKNLKSVKKKSKKEVEKLFVKVSDSELIRTVIDHDMIKRASKMGNEFSKEFERWYKDVGGLN